MSFFAGKGRQVPEPFQYTGQRNGGWTVAIMFLYSGIMIAPIILGSLFMIFTRQAFYDYAPLILCWVGVVVPLGLLGLIVAYISGERAKAMRRPEQHTYNYLLGGGGRSVHVPPPPAPTEVKVEVEKPAPRALPQGQIPWVLKNGKKGTIRRKN